MTSAFDLPARAVSGAVEGLGSLGEAARRAPELQRELLSLLRSIERRMGDLPAELEKTLRGHFEGQRKDIQSLRPELERNRQAAESLPAHIDGLREDLRELRSEMSGVRSEVSEVRSEVSDVRAIVEPLQGPAERAARISDRLPGGG